MKLLEITNKIVIANLKAGDLRECIGPFTNKSKGYYQILKVFDDTMSVKYFSPDGDTKERTWNLFLLNKDRLIARNDPNALGIDKPTG